MSLTRKSFFSTTRNRLLILFLIFGLIPALLLGGFFYHQSRDALLENTYSRLRSLRKIQQEGIENFFSQARIDVESLALSPLVLELFLEARTLFHGSAGGTGEGKHAEWLAGIARDRFDFLVQFAKRREYYDLFLIDAVRGDVLFTVARESDLGKNVIEGPLKASPLGKLFQKVGSGVVLHDFQPYQPSNNRLSAFIGAPLVREGKRVGVVALQFSVDAIEDWLRIHHGPGKSGQSFLVGRQDGVTSWRGHPHPGTAPTGGSGYGPVIEKALSGTIGQESIITDTGQRRLVGYAPLRITDLNWAILTTISFDEVQAPVLNLVWSFLTCLLIISILLVWGAYLVASSFSAPIHLLSATAARFSAGDLSARSPELDIFELNTLARAFNEMACNVETNARQLMAANAQLEHLLTMSRVVIYRARAVDDFATGFISANVKQLLGYDRGEIIGDVNFFIDHLHADDRDRFLGEIETILKNGGGETEYRFLHGNGSYRWMLDQIHLVRDEDGEPFEIIGNMTDITDLKSIERTVRDREKRLRTILDFTSEGIFGLNNDGKTTFVNPAAVRMCGWPPEALIGKNQHERLHHSHADGSVYPWETCPIHLTMVDGLVRRIDNEVFWRKDGTSFPVEYVSTPILGEADDIQGAVVVFRDLTDLLHSQKERADREKAEAANAAKSEFLANMSHEIRTPMNAILGFTGLALSSDISPMARHFFTKIDWASQTLLRVVNDILDFSKIEAGKLGLESVTFNLHDLCEPLADLFGQACADKGVALNLWSPKVCQGDLIGDPTRLKQVLINLVGNAVKFTGAGEITVEVEALELNFQRVRLAFSVRDTGSGMSPEQIARLFTPFEQGDGSTSRKYGGTGLGLSICKHLVEMMDGRIDVSSTVGRGSDIRFTVVLDRRENGRTNRLTTPEGLIGLRILVVDDNATNRARVLETLTSFRFNVTAVASAREAMETIRIAALGKKPHELVLVDQRLAEMDGEALAGRILESLSYFFPRLPVPRIILMAVGGDGELRRHANVDALLVKPICLHTLFNTILSVLEPVDPWLSDPGKTVDASHPEIDFGVAERTREKMAGSRVLLVEDNAINRDVARHILEKVDIFVEEVDNGRDAVSMAIRTPYEAILMDLQMPEMDGLETARRIREHPRGREVPIIALTAHALKGDREKCLAAGMNDHVAKPIDNKKLFAALERWIDRKEPTPRPDRAGTVTAPATGETASLPETLDGIDRAQAMERFMGDAAVFRAMLMKMDQHANATREIRTALDDGDRQGATDRAHAIKGLAGNLAADELHRLAEALEEGIRRGDVDGSSDELTLFDQGLQRILKTVHGLDPGPEDSRVSDPIPPSTATPIDRRRLAPVIRNLAGLLRDRDMAALAALNPLVDLLKGSVLREEVRQLEERMANIDFAGAGAILRTMAQNLDISLEESGS